MTAQEIDELTAKLADPVWRLTSGQVYKIKTADGRGIIPFVPRPEQVTLLLKLLEAVNRVKAHAESLAALATAAADAAAARGAQGTSAPSGKGPPGRAKAKKEGLAVAAAAAAPLRREAGWVAEPFDPPQEVEIKSRRLGYSTAVGVFVADCLGFRKHFTAQLIDQTADEAAKKMSGIVKVAVDSLIALGWPLKKAKDSDTELTVDLDIGEPCAGCGSSTFYAGTKGRGGSVDFGWYSELGVIQFDDPPRAEEIVTGAFPAARHGVKFVETTWKGGKAGKLWEMIQPALTGVARDWRVHFTPWYVDPRNRSRTAALDEPARQYFAEIAPRLQREGVVLDEEQMRWYAAERRTLGIFMRRENPTFLDECWAAPIEGSVYAAAIERARAEGRVTARLGVDGNHLVHTAWDLGAPANTIVWYFQTVGREIWIVDVDAAFGGTLVERAAMMRAKGYAFGRHFLPHDAAQTERTGATVLSELAPHLPGLVPVPKCHTEWVGINHLLQMFPSLVFRAPACEQALETLACYRVRQEGPQAGELVHDGSSHTADALRTMAEAHRAGLFKFNATAAQPRPDWYETDPTRRRIGMKPRIVSGVRIYS